MKRTRRLILLFPIFVLLGLLTLSSCKSKVEQAKESIDKDFDIEVVPTLKPVIVTMPFYLYAVPENYWYPEGTTIKEILEDNFKYGYKNLGRLDDEIGAIQTDNSDINIAIDTLHVRIEATCKKLRKAQKAIEMANSIFGFGLYGGIGTLYDFSLIFGGNKSDGDNDETKMPKEVRGAFNQLVDTIELARIHFFKVTHDFENNLVNSESSLKHEQLMAIRLYLISKIRKNIVFYYVGSDTTDRNKSIQRIIITYKKAFPIN